jgi:hypothetical protein
LIASSASIVAPRFLFELYLVSVFEHARESRCFDDWSVFAAVPYVAAILYMLQDDESCAFLLIVVVLDCCSMSRLLLVVVAIAIRIILAVVVRFEECVLKCVRFAIVRFLLAFHKLAQLLRTTYSFLPWTFTEST